MFTYYYLFHHLSSEDRTVLAVGVGSADVGSIGKELGDKTKSRNRVANGRHRCLIRDFMSPTVFSYISASST